MAKLEKVGEEDPVHAAVRKTPRSSSISPASSAIECPKVPHLFASGPLPPHHHLFIDGTTLIPCWPRHEYSYSRVPGGSFAESLIVCNCDSALRRQRYARAFKPKPLVPTRTLRKRTTDHHRHRAIWSMWKEKHTNTFAVGPITLAGRTEYSLHGMDLPYSRGNTWRDWPRTINAV